VLIRLGATIMKHCEEGSSQPARTFQDLEGEFFTRLHLMSNKGTTVAAIDSRSWQAVRQQSVNKSRQIVQIDTLIIYFDEVFFNPSLVRILSESSRWFGKHSSMRRKMDSGWRSFE
jgi:hypothetical protein